MIFFLPQVSTFSIATNAQLSIFFFAKQIFIFCHKVCRKAGMLMDNVPPSVPPAYLRKKETAHAEREPPLGEIA